MTTVPMVGLTACEATSVVNPNDGGNILVVCVLPPGHAGAHWARVTGWWTWVDRTNGRGHGCHGPDRPADGR